MVVVCVKCYGEFASTRDLERHLQRKIPCDVGDYKCSGCSQPFQTQKNLNEHINKQRCKGKSAALVAHELAEQNARLENQLQQQEQLLRMTNAVTAAAAIYSPTTNITQHNHITINIHNNVSNLGGEKLSHFSQLPEAERLQKLTLTRGVKALADWCAILRADEEHPENHNALLLAADSKEMACCRDGTWSWDEREKTLLEITRCDLMRLYTHLGQYDSNAHVQDFRQEYILHDLMTKSNTGCESDLKPVMDAIARPIIELTQKFYATTVEDVHLNEDDVKLKHDIAELQESLASARASFEQHEAKQTSVLMRLQRRMAERARASTTTCNNQELVKSVEQPTSADQ